MRTTYDEIADGVFRFSTWLPDVGEDGFTVNQFVLLADEPLLFHCGYRWLFPDLSGLARRVLRVETLRWIAFGHLEADESGSMNQWLAAAPDAQVLHGEVGCGVSLNDLADRAPRAIGDGALLDIGTKRIRHVDTPHVPHGWDARVIYEETTGTLFCGDLFTHTGEGPPIRDDDIVERALAADDAFTGICLTPATAPTIRRLADLEPRTLALMHGSSFDGDCVEALHALADGYEQRLLNTMP